MKQNTMRGRLLPLILLSCTGSIFLIPFLPMTFYLPFKTVFGLTNIQMGWLLSFCSIVNIPVTMLNGWLCDRFDPKAMLVSACILSGVLGLCIATIPSYPVLVVLFMGVTVSIGLLQWAPYTKCIHILGTSEEQGRMFGFSRAIDSAVSLLLGIGLSAFLGMRVSSAEGFRLLVTIISIFPILVGIALIPLFNYKKYISRAMPHKQHERISLKGYFACLKMPALWIMALMTLGNYIISTAMNYISPYFNTAFSISPDNATMLLSFLRYGVGIFATPIGGMLRDKLYGRSSPIVFLSCAGCAVTAVVFACVPHKAAVAGVAIIATILFAVFYHMNFNSRNTPITELKVPLHVVGSLVGLSSAVGYSTDLFLPTLCGYWLDRYGAYGYRMIFCVLLAGLTVVAAAGVYLRHETQKKSIMTI